MKRTMRRLVSMTIALLLILTGSVSVFAASYDVDVMERTYNSNYTTDTSLNSGKINAGNFNVGIELKNVGWLGVTDGNDGKKRTGNIRIRTGAGTKDLSEYLPNLNNYAISEEIAMSRMAGNTFLCKNQPVSWNGTTGQWETRYTDPSGKIKTALDGLKSSLTCEKIQFLRYDEGIGSWTDNKIDVKRGTIIQFGRSRMEFNSDYTVNDLYDPVLHPNSYASQFAHFVKTITGKITYSTVPDSGISVFIPKGTVAQFSETKVTVNKDITIEIQPGNSIEADPLSALYTAMKTANGSTSTKYFGYSCDADAITESALGCLNELIGVLAQPGTKINTGEDKIIEPDSSKSAIAKISIRSASLSAQPCQHKRTRSVDSVEPTIYSEGYTGHVCCDECGIFLGNGKTIARLKPSIKLNYNKIPLQVKQSTKVVKVTYQRGDSIKSVKSSKTGVVKAVKSGSNGIKLTAGKKTGTAKVTVTLDSKKTATINVTVQKTEVACTGIKVKSAAVNLKKGKTHQIKTEIQPVTCVQKITYKTSNKKVATVTNKGRIKAVKKGKATITVKCGKKTKKIKVTVK